MAQVGGTERPLDHERLARVGASVRAARAAALLHEVQVLLPRVSRPAAPRALAVRTRAALPLVPFEAHAQDERARHA